VTVYNKEQWISSFEGQMSLLRPHLVGRALDVINLGAWHKHGTHGNDPTQAAREESAALDQSWQPPKRSK
jgi:hypothetical protein